MTYSLAIFTGNTVTYRDDYRSRDEAIAVGLLFLTGTADRVVLQSFGAHSVRCEEL